MGRDVGDAVGVVDQSRTQAVQKHDRKDDRLSFSHGSPPVQGCCGETPAGVAALVGVAVFPLLWKFLIQRLRVWPALLNSIEPYFSNRSSSSFVRSGRGFLVWFMCGLTCVRPEVFVNGNYETVKGFRKRKT
jgi:hypothetical protein